MTGAPSRLALRLSALVLLAATLRPLDAAAQHEHMDIYSTEPGGGSLVLDWDFDKRVVTFPVFCAAGLCLSSTISPAFMAPDIGADERGLYRIADGVSAVLINPLPGNYQSQISTLAPQLDSTCD